MPMFDYNLNPLPRQKVSAKLPVSATFPVLASITAADLDPAAAAPTKAEFDAVVGLVNALKAQSNAMTAVIEAIKNHINALQTYLAELDANLNLSGIRE